MAMNEVADSILDGTIEFPPDTELYTKLLLQEALRIFEQTSRHHLDQFLRTDDFQTWWLRANEDIQSSPSLLHFGHYCCAAHEDYLSTIHTAKLNLALATGIGLDRWSKGLTVLLMDRYTLKNSGQSAFLRPTSIGSPNFCSTRE